MQTKLTRRNYEDFLLRAYFGEQYLTEPLLACIDRSYQDFSRTLHGIAGLSDKDRIHEEIKEWLVNEIRIEINRDKGSSHKQFDHWHERVCVELKQKYESKNFYSFHIGQSQKWVNMVYKYAYTFGEERLPGFSKFYNLCHVPIDNFVLERLIPLGFPKMSTAWSRIDDYREYFSAQEWLRSKFAVPALDVKFYAWQHPRRDLSPMMHQQQPH